MKNNFWKRSAVSAAAASLVMVPLFGATAHADTISGAKVYNEFQDAQGSSFILDLSNVGSQGAFINVKSNDGNDQWEITCENQFPEMPTMPGECGSVPLSFTGNTRYLTQMELGPGMMINKVNVKNVKSGETLTASISPHTLRVENMMMYVNSAKAVWSSDISPVNGFDIYKVSNLASNQKTLLKTVSGSTREYTLGNLLPATSNNIVVVNNDNGEELLINVGTTPSLVAWIEVDPTTDNTIMRWYSTDTLNGMGTLRIHNSYLPNGYVDVPGGTFQYDFGIKMKNFVVNGGETFMLSDINNNGNQDGAVASLGGGSHIPAQNYENRFTINHDDKISADGKYNLNLSELPAMKPLNSRFEVSVYMSYNGNHTPTAEDYITKTVSLEELKNGLTFDNLKPSAIYEVFVVEKTGFNDVVQLVNFPVIPDGNIVVNDITTESNSAVLDVDFGKISPTSLIMKNNTNGIVEYFDPNKPIVLNNLKPNTNYNVEVISADTGEKVATTFMTKAAPANENGETALQYPTIVDNDGWENDSITAATTEGVVYTVSHNKETGAWSIVANATTAIIDKQAAEAAGWSYDAQGNWTLTGNMSIGSTPSNEFITLDKPVITDKNGVKDDNVVFPQSNDKVSYTGTYDRATGAWKLIAAANRGYSVEEGIATAAGWKVNASNENAGKTYEISGNLDTKQDATMKITTIGHQTTMGITWITEMKPINGWTLSEPSGILVNVAGTDREINLTNLKPGTTYNFTLRNNDSGESFTFKGYTNPAKTDFGFKGKATEKSVALTWNEDEGAIQGWRLESDKPVFNGSTSKIVSPNTLSDNLTGLKGGTYTFTLTNIATGIKQTIKVDVPELIPPVMVVFAEKPIIVDKPGYVSDKVIAPKNTDAIAYKLTYNQKTGVWKLVATIVDVPANEHITFNNGSKTFTQTGKLSVSDEIAPPENETPKPPTRVDTGDVDASNTAQNGLIGLLVGLMSLLGLGGFVARRHR